MMFAPLSSRAITCWGLAVLIQCAAVQVPAESYADWRWRQFGSLTNASGQPAADPDRDGYANLEEYALGGQATTADAALCWVDLSGAESVPLIVYGKGTSSDVSYRTVWRSSLAGAPWLSRGVGPEAPFATPGLFQRELPMPTAGQALFARMIVDQPAELAIVTFTADPRTVVDLSAPAGSSAAVGVDASGSNDVALLEGELATVSVALPPYTGAFTVSWRVLASAGDAVFSLKRAGGAVLQLVVEGTNGVLRTMGGTDALGEVGRDGWHRLAVVGSGHSPDCEVWLDGVRLARDVQWGGVPRAPVRWTAALASVGAAWSVDDIRLFGDRRPAEEDEIDAILAALGSQYDELLDWLATLYDPATGGFYHAPSSISSTNVYVPTVETTSQALSILEYAGLLPDMPAAVKDKLLTFFRERQGVDGFFRDGIPGLDDSSSQMGRNLSYAKLSFRRLQSVPATGTVNEYPPFEYPDQESVVRQYPELESAPAFTAWCNGLPWDTPYPACGQIQSRAGAIAQLSEQERAAIVAALLDVLDARQSPVTGFWGELVDEVGYEYLSGAFKVCLTLNSLRLVPSHSDEIYQSCRRTLIESDPALYTFVRNPVSLVEFLRHKVSRPYRPHELAEIAGLIAHTNRRFRRADGGFSRYADKGFAGDVIPLSDKLLEGEMNSTSQAVGPVRSTIYRMYGVQIPPLAGSDSFYDDLLNP